MKVKESNYIWPPRATAAIPFEDAMVLYEDLEWIGQLKYNDTRLLIKYAEDGTITLWNRHGEQLRSYVAPEFLMEQLEKLPERLELGKGWHLIDGGLLEAKHRAIKDTVVIWDILVQNGESPLDTTYGNRYQKLWGDRTERPWNAEDHAWHYKVPGKSKSYPIGEMIDLNILMPRTLQPSDWVPAWAMLDQINQPFLEAGYGPLIEGIVFKDPTGLLEMGWQEKNNAHWMARSRVATGRHAF